MENLTSPKSKSIFSLISPLSFFSSLRNKKKASVLKPPAFEDSNQIDQVRITSPDGKPIRIYKRDSKTASESILPQENLQLDLVSEPSTGLSVQNESPKVIKKGILLRKKGQINSLPALDLIENEEAKRKSSPHLRKPSINKAPPSLQEYCTSNKSPNEAGFQRKGAKRVTFAIHHVQGRQITDNLLSPNLKKIRKSVRVQNNPSIDLDADPAHRIWLAVTPEDFKTKIQEPKSLAFPDSSLSTLTTDEKSESPKLKSSSNLPSIGSHLRIKQAGRMMPFNLDISPTKLYYNKETSLSPTLNLNSSPLLSPAGPFCPIKTDLLFEPRRSNRNSGLKLAQICKDGDLSFDNEIQKGSISNRDTTPISNRDRRISQRVLQVKTNLRKTSLSVSKRQ